jgi:hypothetical protein
LNLCGFPVSVESEETISVYEILSECEVINSIDIAVEVSSICP